MEKETLEIIFKCLPENKRLLGMIFWGIIVIILTLLKRKKRNSSNLTNAEIGDDLDIYIGNKKSNNQEYDELNSNNLNNSKIGKNAKIKIGDDNVE